MNLVDRITNFASVVILAGVCIALIIVTSAGIFYSLGLLKHSLDFLFR
jgi:hypothetical protein